MTEFTYDTLGSRVRFGDGALKLVPDELDRLGVRRCLVIAAGSSQDVGEELGRRLGGGLAGHFREVRQHVPEELARRAAARTREVEADGVVTVGGGSAIGLGKAVAVELGVPVVAVPTTYSGSEMTPIYGITGERKRSARDPRARPKAVVYDPELTVGLPRRLSATSGLNALAHCVEALYVPEADPVSGLLAEEGMRALARALPGVVERPADLDARRDALYGAFLAGSALATTGIGLHHRLCHLLGGSFGLPHADTHAVLLPYTAAYNAPAARGPLARVAAAVGGVADADAVGGLLYDLGRAVGVPVSLADVGMPRDGLAVVAEEGPAQVTVGNPRPVDAAALRQLLDDAHAGRRP